MKLSFLVVTFLFTLLCFISPAHAANSSAISERVNQLLESRICVGCDLHNANLYNADLRGVDLTRANLRHANLSGANLMAAILKGADLSNANLSGADLLVVDLSGATLQGANVDKVDPTTLRLCHTIGSDGKELNRDC